MPRNTRSSPGADTEPGVSQKNTKEERKRPREEPKQEDTGNKARNTSARADLLPAATKNKSATKVSTPNRALGAFSSHLAPKQAKGAKAVEQEGSRPSWSKDDLMKLMDAVRAECSGTLSLSSDPTSGGDPDYLERLACTKLMIAMVKLMQGIDSSFFFF
jgi:hypothetical protein